MQRPGLPGGPRDTPGSATSRTVVPYGHDQGPRLGLIVGGGVQRTSRPVRPNRRQLGYGRLSAYSSTSSADATASATSWSAMTPNACASISRLAGADYRTASRVKPSRTARTQSIGMAGPRLAETLPLARASADRRTPACGAMSLRRPTPPESCYRQGSGNTIPSSRGRPAATGYRPAEGPPPTVGGGTRRGSLLTLPPEATPRARVEGSLPACVDAPPVTSQPLLTRVSCPYSPDEAAPPGRVHSQRRRMPPLRCVVGHPTRAGDSPGMREFTPPAAHRSLQWRTLPWHRKHAWPLFRSSPVMLRPLGHTSCQLPITPGC
jgi:hypothetical protein